MSKNKLLVDILSIKKDSGVLTSLMFKLKYKKSYRSDGGSEMNVNHVTDLIIYFVDKFAYVCH